MICLLDQRFINPMCGGLTFYQLELSTFARSYYIVTYVEIYAGISFWMCINMSFCNGRKPTGRIAHIDECDCSLRFERRCPKSMHSDIHNYSLVLFINIQTFNSHVAAYKNSTTHDKRYLIACCLILLRKSVHVALRLHCRYCYWT